MSGGAQRGELCVSWSGGRAITENGVPKGSVMAAIRPYSMSSGAPDVPPAAMARSTTTSVSATSNVVAQADDGASGEPKIPATSWPSGLRRKVKSKSGRSSLRSSVKSKTAA
jgi:hypothetical protein